MIRKRDSGYKIIHSYHLSPRQLEELHRKYGRPGEISPGIPAKKKRNRLDMALAAMDRRGNDIVPVNEEMEDDIT